MGSILQAKTLVQAVTDRDIDEVKSLLNNNRADFDETDKNGMTAIHIACKIGNKAILSLILENSNRKLLESRGRIGSTPLMIAIEYGHPEIAEVLIENGAHIDALSKDKKSILILLIQNKMMPLIKKYFNKIPDINHTDLYGKTALIYAVEIAGFYLVEYLLMRGADPSIADRTGKTALDYATNEEMKAFLNKKIIEVSLQNDRKHQGRVSFRILHDNVHFLKMLFLAVIIVGTVLIGLNFYLRSKRFEKAPHDQAVAAAKLIAPKYCSKFMTCHQTGEDDQTKCVKRAQQFIANIIKMQGSECNFKNAAVCSNCLRDMSCDNFKQFSFNSIDHCSMCGAICD